MRKITLCFCVEYVSLRHRLYWKKSAELTSSGILTCLVIIVMYTVVDRSPIDPLVFSYVPAVVYDQFSHPCEHHSCLFPFIPSTHAYIAV